MYEVQGEVNVTMNSDVSEVKFEGKIAVRNDVCLRYRVGKY